MKQVTLDGPEDFIFEEVNFAEVKAEIESMKQKFIYDERLNTLTLNIVYPYEVDLCRIKTYKDLLGWVHHLSEKILMTPCYIRLFIEQVCNIKGWGLH